MQHTYHQIIGMIEYRIWTEYHCNPDSCWEKIAAVKIYRMLKELGYINLAEPETTNNEP
jgi:hypothetical protein